MNGTGPGAVRGGGLRGRAGAAGTPERRLGCCPSRSGDHHMAKRNSGAAGCWHQRELLMGVGMIIVERAQQSGRRGGREQRAKPLAASEVGRLGPPPQKQPGHGVRRQTFPKLFPRRRRAPHTADARSVRRSQWLSPLRCFCGSKEERDVVLGNCV